MITLDNIRTESIETKFYAPPYFATNIALLLQNNDIEFQLIDWRKLRNDTNTISVRQQWHNRFATLLQNATSPNTMMCIISHCNTDDLFNIATQMTGPNIDTDFEAQELKHKNTIRNDYYNKYPTDTEI